MAKKKRTKKKTSKKKAGKKTKKKTKKSTAKKKSTKKKSTKKKSTKKKSTKKKAATTTTTAASAFPKRIFANASPVAAASMFEAGTMADVATIGSLASDMSVVERAVHLLSDAGFEVLHATPLMINIAGSRKVYERAFGTELVAEERPTIKQEGIEDTATYFDTTDTDVQGLISAAGTRFEGLLDGIAIEEPVYLATPTSFPPPVDYWHLDVPADVSLGCNADKAHRGGTTGAGVTVAMVDTGWQSHPFFTDRGYRVDPVVLGPGTSDPTIDESGHGTGESANIFATAPDVLLKPVKAALATGQLVNMTAAFNAAVALNPDIITNSWVSNIQTGPLSAAMQARAAAVAAAVASGIVVLFSAGNGHWGFPGQHPDVISVGGVFVDQDGSMRASDYSSGFMSNVYPGRRVPDVSGLVGMLPGASYIMLPLPEGCAIDVSKSGGSHPPGDETANDDGWAAFSGTSASCPQVAGVCALIKQACSRLDPFEIRDILMTTARDVTTGTNHPNFGNNAVASPDTATGDGLVDAHRAVLIAKLRCIALPVVPLPFQPLQPTVPLTPLPFAPFQPLQPTLPLTPLQPVLPVRPFRPTLPLQPVLPLTPFRPLAPLTPIRPFRPLAPLRPFAPFGAGAETGSSLNAEDLAALEKMIIDSEEDPSGS